MSFRTRVVLASVMVFVVAGSAAGIAATKKKVVKIPDDRTNNVARQIVGGQARNVILLIGDGMDETAITAARNYELGANGRLNMDRMRLSGSVTTYALNELMGSDKPYYVTDSAASGTAWATGHKTGLLRISTEAFTNRALPTIAELAKKNGYRTGNVSNDSVTGATPAAQMSHVRLRNCSSPQDQVCGSDAKVAGGLGSISEQAADSSLDLIMGGGMNDFDDVIAAGPDAGKTVVESAQRQGFSLVTDAAGMSANYMQSKRLLGLFAGGTMTSEWTGEKAVDSNRPAAQRCLTDQRPATQPALSSMTNHAIAFLNRKPKHKKKGFFLQIEGADIDKGSHAADPCRMIGGLLAFDRAVAAAVSFAKKSPRTLVIVSADHGQSAQILPFPGIGRNAQLTTNEGSPLFLGYATAEGDGDQEHAGITVPIKAMGPQAANVTGLKNQTDVFKVITGALGIKAPVSEAASD